MITISRDWWEHLAAKVMHRRRSEIETLPRQWCGTGYGVHWLRVARQEGALSASLRHPSATPRSCHGRTREPPALADARCPPSAVFRLA